MNLSHAEILKVARDAGIPPTEAKRIANQWCGQVAPPSMYLSMAWNSLFIDTADDRSAQSFRRHSDLLRLGQAKAYRNPGNRVTDFTNWVFGLCFPGRRKRVIALKMGKNAEEHLLKQHRARQLLRLPEPQPQDRHWELIFRDPLTTVEPFRISSLTVNGSPMYGVPDIVYRNRKTGEIKIVEIKATHAEVPPDGWPNLRAQLWCYSQIDQWADAPKISLVGQIWSPRATELRRTLVWNKADISFNRPCRELFDCYVGNTRQCGQVANHRH